MNSIRIEYALGQDGPKPYLIMKALDGSWSGGKLSGLFGEIAEGLLRTSYDQLCIDLSSLSLVSSGIFGACVNIVDTAKQSGKSVKFRLNAAALETAKMASFDKLVTLELAYPDQVS
jgi:ABC-type transporter Mla MlaB component